MYSLGINMAVQPYSFSVVEDTTIRLSYMFQSSYRQSEQMMTIIKAQLLAHSMALSELSGIGVVQGPGQYTGVRMGVTLAKSLSMGLDIPIVGITTFSAMLLPYLETDGVYLTCIPARKNEFNVQLMAVKDKHISIIVPSMAIQSTQLMSFLSRFESPIDVISTVPISMSSTVRIHYHYVDTTAVARHTTQCIVESKTRLSDVVPIYSHQPVLGKTKQHSKRGNI